MSTAIPNYPLAQTVREALDAIQRHRSDIDSGAKDGTAAHNRWLARIDRIESVLAFVGGPSALARVRSSVCGGAFDRVAA